MFVASERYGRGLDLQLGYGVPRRTRTPADTYFGEGGVPLTRECEEQMAEGWYGCMGAMGGMGDMRGMEWIHWDLLGSTGIYWGPLGSTGVHWDPLGSTGIHWGPLGSTGVHWDPLGSTGIHCGSGRPNSLLSSGILSSGILLSGILSSGILSSGILSSTCVIHLAAVFLLSPPASSASYMHLSGRTGRMGAVGVAVTLVTHRQVPRLVAFANDLGIPFEPAGSELELGDSSTPPELHPVS